ncbi:uncharacterized protein SPSK_01703 [Sporothrix schenckii 1099-18]|uniref:Protein kinase domain-containing protein n=1 Tax=Sporothrix schenckii 1099-18 TaxID=1397361 RepID=A0A0F2ME57_SPOSC|nr:uncharacterized protein SPSK_01703 [Sporothrix schenckii 1099-18]KJR87130.1 hypothetical protein SPSK_01703 [Sporothrix schenckii 1099-18]
MSLYEYHKRQDRPRPGHFPYYVGRTFTIRRHWAPPPFKNKYAFANGMRQHHDYSRGPLGLTKLERCLRHPPQEWPLDEEGEAEEGGDEDGNNAGQDEGQDGGQDADAVFDRDGVYTLEIVEEIVARDGHGAQILRCRVESVHSSDKPAPESHFVAKIYDAAYYRDDSDWFGDLSFDADGDYASEVHAYEHLCTVGANGRYTPRYYGSWTFDLPVPPKEEDVSSGLDSGPMPLPGFFPGYVRGMVLDSGSDSDRPRPATRSVRLIIIEYLAGSSMYAMLVKGVVDAMPIPRRLEVMAKTMESLCQVEFLGIEHKDFEPRNGVLLDAAPKTNGPSTPPAPPNTITDEDNDNDVRNIVIIDFNHSYVVNSRWLADRWRRDRQNEVRCPMHRFWRRSQEQFAAWIPHVYHMRLPVFNGWLKHRWASQVDRYYTPSPRERYYSGLDDATEYIPPESITLPETRIPGRILHSFDPDYGKEPLDYKKYVKEKFRSMGGGSA